MRASYEILTVLPARRVGRALVARALPRFGTVQGCCAGSSHGIVRASERHAPPSRRLSIAESISVFRVLGESGPTVGWGRRLAEQRSYDDEIGLREVCEPKSELTCGQRSRLWTRQTCNGRNPAL